MKTNTLLCCNMLFFIYFAIQKKRKSVKEVLIAGRECFSYFFQFYRL